MEYLLFQLELSQRKLQNPWDIIKFRQMFAKGAVTDGMMMMHTIVSIVVTRYNKRGKNYDKWKREISSDNRAVEI
jgi:hypothetical protein